MKKVVYLVSIVLALGFYSCEEAKKDAVEVEEGFKEAEKTMENHPMEKVEEGFKEAGETMEEGAEEVKEEVKEVGHEIKEEVKELKK